MTAMRRNEKLGLRDGDVAADAWTVRAGAPQLLQNLHERCGGNSPCLQTAHMTI